jgi:HK97 family phage portal protein
MTSLIGKALQVRNAVTAPVPMSDGSRYSLPGLPIGPGGQEAYMSAAGSVGTVWQIVHLLSSNTAKPEWRLYRKQQRDGRVRYTTSDQGSDQRTEVLKHMALTVLHRPNPFYSRFGLMEASQQYLELTGESWWVIDRDPRSSVPLGLWLVRPDRMTPVPHPVKYLSGYVYTAPDGREKIPLALDEVVFIKFPNPLDPYRGLGPAQSVLVEIDSAKYAGQWNRNFFINSAEPGGIIQLDHRYDDDEFNQLVNRWRESHRGVAKAHRVGVLEGGATWVPNTHSQRDMDFAKLRDQERDLIREAWGIHKIMLGNSDDVNRANAQTGEEVFANWSVSPRLDRWRDALNNQFLPLFYPDGAEVPVEFDYIYPLPQNREQDNAELLAKTAAAQTLIASGFDAHAVLEVVGLPDMTWSQPTAGQGAGEAEADDSDRVNPGRLAVSGRLDGAPRAAAAAGEDDMTARLRRMLSNGHMPVTAGSR